MPEKLAGRKISFSHFGLSCIDIAAMTKFYTEVMGMIVSDGGEIPRAGIDIAFLTTDPEDHHQMVLASGRKDRDIDMSPVMGGHIGAMIFQMSFRLERLADLRSMVERMKAAGITTFTPVSHGNAWAVYSRDIEGNAVELFVDTPWYVAQPCGEPLDLNLSDEEIYAATEAYCKAQPEMQPHDEWSREQARKIVAAQAGI